MKGGSIKQIYLDENLMKRIKPTKGKRDKRVIDGF
jgi:hypothetical protein